MLLPRQMLHSRPSSKRWPPTLKPVMSSESAFSCQVCLEYFASAQEFRQHLKFDKCQPLDNGDATFVCDQCHQVLTSISEFKLHRLSHRDGENFVCSACSASFETKHALRRHMLVDGSVLNRLMARKDPALKLPDKLCRRTVERLAKKAKLLGKFDVNVAGTSSGFKQEEEEEDDSDDDNDDDFDDDSGEDADCNHDNINITERGTSDDRPDLEEDNAHMSDSMSPIRFFTQLSGGQSRAKRTNMNSQKDAIGDRKVTGNTNFDEESFSKAHVNNSMHSDEEIIDSDRQSCEEEEMAAIPHPFLSASLTDSPPPAISHHDGDLISQTLTDDAAALSEVDTLQTLPSVSSSSRRKSKHPRPVFRPQSSQLTLFATQHPPRNCAEGAVWQRGLNDCDRVDEETNKTQESSADVENQNSLSKEIFPCPMCGDRLQSVEQLSAHVAEHEKLFPFFCALCDANFCDGRLLRKHVAERHVTEQSLQCKACGMYFKQRGSLATHSKFCRQSPACIVCSRRFSSGADLEKHYYSHTEEERASAKTLSCKDCGEVFLSVIQLKEHMKTHGEARPYICDICKASFTAQRSLDKHRALHRQQQECRCEICGVQLLTRSGYKAHMRGHKNTEAALFGLGEQGRLRQLQAVKVEEKSGETSTFEYLKLLDPENNSMGDSTDENSSSSKKSKKRQDGATDEKLITRLIQCPFCSLTFSSSERLQVHIRRLHREAELEPCDICNKKFYGKEYLQKHRLTHANYTDVFPCDQCSKVFRRKWSLETHRKIHTFQKFLECDICGEQFRFVSEVDKHKHREHQYDKEQAFYVCNICGMKFASLSHLSIHSSHSHRPGDGLPFKCTRCDSAFLTCNELKKHIYRSNEVAPCTGVKQEPPDTFEDASNSLGDGSASGVELAKTLAKKALDGSPLQGETSRTFHASGGKRESSMKMAPKVDNTDDSLDDSFGPASQSQTGVEAYNELTRQSMMQSRLLKRFICETCHKCFATKSDLRTHIRTHTGETPYQCEFCDRAFKQRGHRKLHIQVAHTKDMPYRCEICGQAYPTRYRYQIHLKRHTGVKEHQCEFCNKEYYTVGKLNEHKRKHHVKELQQREKEAQAD